MKKNKISKEWISRQRRDIYVRKSKQEGFRSRSIYKLQEINDKYKILKNGLYVMLPSENLEKSIELYNIFLKSNVSKKIKSIDLRILNQISITYENK